MNGESSEGTDCESVADISNQRVRNGGKEYRKNESLEGILYQSFIFKGKNKLIMKSRKRYASM